VVQSRRRISGAPAAFRHTETTAQTGGGPEDVLAVACSECCWPRVRQWGQRSRYRWTWRIGNARYHCRSLHGDGDGYFGRGQCQQHDYLDGPIGLELVSYIALWLRRNA
jgi:hypothetical protein